MSEPSDEEKRTKKISFGPAELRPFEEEAGHVGLYRPLFFDGWDETTGEFIRVTADRPVGPLAVFREARGTEAVDMRTIDPVSQRELRLHCVWDPSHTFMRGREG